MLPELQRRFDAVEGQRAELLRQADALNAEQWNWKADADAWSAGQIIEHLVLSDETVGRAQEAGKVRNEDLMFRILPRFVRRALVLKAFSRDMVLPLPSPAVEPQGSVSLAELRPRWDTARRNMGRVLDTLRRDETRYSHPVLGPLTATQMLDLEQAHTDHHTRQMQVLQGSAAFPRAVKAM